MVRRALALTVQGADPNALRSGLERASRAACDWIRSEARPVEDGDVAHVAALASRDPHIGKLVAEALGRVGPDGLISVDDHRRTASGSTSAPG